MSIREQIENLAHTTFEEMQQAGANYSKAEVARRVKMELAAIRREYASELQTKYAIDPAKIDLASLELLKSGALQPSEYRTMFNSAAKAGNVTMMRMVTKYAADAAEKNNSNELRAFLYGCNHDPAAEALSVFDSVTEVLDRTVNNPSMISHWEELTEPLLNKI